MTATAITTTIRIWKNEGWEVHGCAPDSSDRCIGLVRFLHYGDFFMILQREAGVKWHEDSDEPIIFNLTRGMVKKVFALDVQKIESYSTEVMK